MVLTFISLSDLYSYDRHPPRTAVYIIYKIMPLQYILIYCYNACIDHSRNQSLYFNVAILCFGSDSFDFNQIMYSSIINKINKRLNQALNK